MKETLAGQEDKCAVVHSFNAVVLLHIFARFLLYIGTERRNRSINQSKDQSSMKIYNVLDVHIMRHYVITGLLLVHVGVLPYVSLIVKSLCL